MSRSSPMAATTSPIAPLPTFPIRGGWNSAWRPWWAWGRAGFSWDWRRGRSSAVRPASRFWTARLPDELGDDLIDQHDWRFSYPDGDGALLRCWLLEGGELARQQARRHEMAVPRHKTMNDERLIALQIDKTDI